jgi:methionyl-tRNA formyltransferase
MKKKSKTIVFFGSGPVAAESLALLLNEFEVEAVVTRPSPAHHKGKVPVFELADSRGLKTFTPANSAELSKLFARQPVKSQLGLVIDYGIMLPKDVIDYFPLGVVNSHFSVLPEWRGADPISFAILSGQPTTGVSLMLLTEALDEGELLAYQEYSLKPDETTPELTAELIKLSHELLVKTLPGYFDGETKPFPQSATGRAVSHSRKLTKQDSIIDWNKPATELEREVRAYTGWPRSRTQIGYTDVIVTAAHAINGAGEPGTLWIHEKQLGISTSDGILVIDKLIPAGKKEMPAEAFLAGYKIS